MAAEIFVLKKTTTKFQKVCMKLNPVQKPMIKKLQAIFHGHLSDQL